MNVPPELRLTDAQLKDMAVLHLPADIAAKYAKFIDTTDFNSPIPGLDYAAKAGFLYIAIQEHLSHEH